MAPQNLNANYEQLCIDLYMHCKGVDAIDRMRMDDCKAVLEEAYLSRDTGPVMRDLFEHYDEVSGETFIPKNPLEEYKISHYNPYSMESYRFNYVARNRPKDIDKLCDKVGGPPPSQATEPHDQPTREIRDTIRNDAHRLREAYRRFNGETVWQSAGIALGLLLVAASRGRVNPFAISAQASTSTAGMAALGLGSPFGMILEAANEFK